MLIDFRPGNEVGIGSPLRLTPAVDNQRIAPFRIRLKMPADPLNTCKQATRRCFRRLHFNELQSIAMLGLGNTKDPECRLDSFGVSEFQTRPMFRRSRRAVDGTLVALPPESLTTNKPIPNHRSEALASSRDACEDSNGTVASGKR